MSEPITLAAFLARIEMRKEELGILDTDEHIEAQRHKGARRTPQKRAALARNAARAKAAGLTPPKQCH